MTVLNSERRTPLDLDAIRQDNPLPTVAGAVVKLQRAGHEWKACCPFHSEKSPSFTIFKGGERFYCFGCGATGDVLDFIQQLHSIGLRGAADMLGTGNLPTVDLPPLPANNDNDNFDAAKAIWDRAVPAQETPAATYLHSRRLTLTIPDSIRFTGLRYGKRGPEHPCLIAAVTGADGNLTGIQRTYLNASGTGKAAVPKAKLSLGRVSGGAIRLAPPSGCLVVCEGLEDGLTLQQALGSAVWVAAGGSMLPSMQFPPEVREIAIGGDNDDAGRAHARKAAAEFAERDLGVRVFFPPSEKDFNAQLTKGAS